MGFFSSREAVLLTKTTLSDQRIQHPIQHLHLSRTVYDIIQRVGFWEDQEKVGPAAELLLCFSHC